MLVTQADLAQSVSQRPHIPAVRRSKPVVWIYFYFVNKFLFLFLLVFLLGYDRYFSPTEGHCAKKIHSFGKIVNRKKWRISDNRFHNIWDKYKKISIYYENDCLKSAISFYWQSYQMNGFFLHIDLQFITNSARNQVKIKIKIKISL